ncbi:arginine--tRNA ligase [Candidatus Heimdallarchaeota archaeon B3_Heim]|nr:MAG: arginine--tRNA ligase [Candidatus Heimdallarchaeota archaeon B3_Heim]
MEKTIKRVLKQVIKPHIAIDSNIEHLIENSIEIPPTFEFGERSTNIAFKLASFLKKSPMKIAEELSGEINSIVDEKSLIVKTTSVKGYINFFINFTPFFNSLYSQIKKEGVNYGENQRGNGKKIIVEHTSINPVKPLHIGNLRNAVLGDCIARLYKRNGWEVEIQNLIDDFGRQVATLIWGILNGHHLGVIREINEKYDVWLGKVYSHCNNILAEQDSWNEVDKIMIDMRHDPHMYRFMRNICQACVDSNLETAWRYGITYDYLVWESDISRSGVWEETLRLLEKNSSFRWEKEGPNAGCFIANLGELAEFQDKKNPDKVFIRSNGIPTYVAHDVALQLWKFGIVKANLTSRSVVKQKNEAEETRDLWTSTDFHVSGEAEKSFGKPDRVCNVIGMEQNYEQEIVRYTLKLLSLKKEFVNSFHMSYKHVSAPHARFSGRSGNWLEERAWADAVFEDTYAAAFKAISKKRLDLEDDPIKRNLIVNSITAAAIRYWLIKFSTETEIKFRIEDATSLEGDTGPFLMYSSVRATKILAKLSKIKTFSKHGKYEITQQEKTLILQLYRCPEIVKNAADSFQPLMVAKYAYDLASSFNRFYETSRVINAKTAKLKQFRLALVQIFSIAMQNLLHILGIPIVDEM